MPYIEFKSLVKKVNLKPNGVKEIVLEVKDSGLNGKLDILSEMIDCKVDVSLDSQVVNFNVMLNANTNQPLTSYKVDERGVVSEVKQESEQLEADLGLPPEKVPTIEEKDEVERQVVDDFIVSGLAPTYDDLVYNFQHIIERNREGESYLKIATELKLSSGKIVELLDEYRKRVAPLAKKWDEWRKEKELEKEQSKQLKQEESPAEDETTDNNNEISDSESESEDDAA